MIRRFKNEREPLAVRLGLMQMLIPVGLVAVEEQMQAEVQALAGARYERGSGVDRWGYNGGSVYLGDQKVSVRVPRVRDRQTNREVPLNSYRGLQNPQMIDELTLRRVLKGLSQRSYEEAAIRIPATFGIRKNSVSKRFIKASAKKLTAFLERDLSAYDIVALVIDGKSYSDTQVVVALGVTVKGEDPARLHRSDHGELHDLQRILEPADQPRIEYQPGNSRSAGRGERFKKGRARGVRRESAHPTLPMAQARECHPPLGPGPAGLFPTETSSGL